MSSIQPISSLNTAPISEELTVCSDSNMIGHSLGTSIQTAPNSTLGTELPQILSFTF